MTSLSSSLHRLRSGLVAPPVELIFTSHPTWPHPKRSIPKRPLQVSVLDSSFNPPTIAHLGLANARRPRYHSIEECNGRDYDAKLLLLSVRNADKELKSTDATYTQRLEMMIRFAQELVTVEDDVRKKSENVAVAIVDEPTFVGKSHLLQRFLMERTNHQQEFRLTFLLGFDTLERFFAPRYYRSNSSSDNIEAKQQMYTSLEGFFAPHGDSSRIVCVRRCPSSYPQFSLPSHNEPTENALQGGPPFDPTIPYSLSSTIRDFLTSRSLPFELIKIIDIGEDVWAVSSSDVRNAILQRDERWKALVPPLVKELIEAMNLYSDNS